MSPLSKRRTETLVLALILLGQLMIVLDMSVVTTALPAIQSTLHFSSANLTWVQNAYTLAFGGLLLLGARAGDILGRRRVFVAGIAVFTLASLAGGLAQSGAWLLIARAVQGVAAAVSAPSTLALLQQTFQEPKARARAIALFSSVMGAGASLGLVLGGFLTEAASWRWSLFINVPIGLLLVLASPRLLPETERRTGHFDLTGAITSTLGMSSLVYGFVRASEQGWSDSFTIASFIAGVLLMVWFVATERRVEQPITPMHLFVSRERTGANVSRLLIVAGMMSMFFFVSQYTQEVLHFSPLQAGLAFLPQTIVLFAMVQVVPRVAKRFAPARMVAAGIAIALIGMWSLSRIGEHSSYFPSVAVPLIFLGIGMGIAFIPLTTLALTGVAPQDAGAASGLVNVSQQVGGSLGLAILVNLFQSQPDLASGVGEVVKGSAVFMTVALAVMLAVGRPRRQPVAAPTEAVVEAA